MLRSRRRDFAENVGEAQPGDLVYLADGFGNLGIPIMGQALFEGIQNALPGVLAGADDEGKPEPLSVGRVQGGEAPEHLVGQLIEPEPGLLAAGFRSEPAGDGEFSREIWMGPDQLHLALSGGGIHFGAHGSGKLCRIIEGTESCDLLGDPGGVFVDSTELPDELVVWHFIHRGNGMDHGPGACRKCRGGATREKRIVSGRGWRNDAVMDVWTAIAEARNAGLPAVVVTVTAVRGSVPGEVGGKLLVTDGGLMAGTIGGGKVEARALEVATALLAEGDVCRMETWNLQRDVGMTCGGEMSFLFERIAGDGSWPVVVFGAGHVSRALVKILSTLRCTVDVVDEREDWLAGIESAPNIRKRHVANFEDGVSWVGKDSYVISITKGHASDRPVIQRILTEFPLLPFIGVIGSVSKRSVLVRELREAGIGESPLARLECPLGLKIGGNDPAEIAVSIVARLLEVRDGPKA